MMMGLQVYPPPPPPRKKDKKGDVPKKTTNTPQMCLGDPEQKSNNFKLLQETFGWESRT